MVTEVVNINIIESGSRVVKRNLDAIGAAADRATRSLYLIQRALFVLGSAGLVRGLANLLDTLTNYENRLRLTATSAANVEGVQRRLFEVARRSRTEFTAVADIYSRTALSARNLGLSQQEVLDITESLSKAAILSGANSREANAALVQLSQGLASNRLGGDELRSILEQLPYVADVIAKYLTQTGKFGQVGRGELRALGKEGKITAQVIVEAFKFAKTGIDTEFGRTNITIEQSIINLKTSFLQLLDQFDDTYNVSTKIAEGIDWIARNLDNIVRAAVGAAEALAVYYAIFKANQIATAVANLISYYEAIKNGTYAVAGSLQAELARTEALAAQAAAYQANTAMTLANAQARVANLRISQAAAAQQVLDTEYTVANGRARSVLTGQFISGASAATNYNTALNALQITTNSLTASEARLAEATLAANAAQAAGTARAAEQAAVQAAASTRWGKFALQFPLMAAGVTKFTGLFRGLFSLLARNPFTAILAGLSALILGITAFGDKIHVATGSLVTLKDYAVVIFQDILNIISPVTDFLGNAFIFAINKVIGAASYIWTAFTVGFETILLGAVTIAEGLLGAFTGTAFAINAAFSIVPGALQDIFINAANLAIAAIQWLLDQAVAKLNVVFSALNSLTQLAGLGDAVTLLVAPTITTLQSDGKAAAAGRAVASEFIRGFKEGAAAPGAAIDAVVTSVQGDALARAQNRAADAALIAKAQQLNGPTTPTLPPGGTGGGGGGSQRKDFAAWMAEKEKELNLLRLIGFEKEKQANIDDAEKTLKRALTEAEKGLVGEITKRLLVAKQENQILTDLRQPQEDFMFRQEAINNLFKNGRIDVAEYRLELAKLRSEMTPENNNFIGGLKAGLNQVAAQTKDFGAGIRDWVTGSFDAASDAIVEFAKTGKFSLRDLFGEIFANLLKLATNQLFSSLIGGILGGFGGGGAGVGGGLGTNLLSGLLGHAHGADFKVGGSGGVDSQIVAFRASPDERVMVQTPEQRRAMENAVNGGSGGGGGTQVVEVTPKVTIINEDDPTRTIHAMNSNEGRKAIINAIKSDAGTIKRLLR